jgi:hypothetical protein
VYVPGSTPLNVREPPSLSRNPPGVMVSVKEKPAPPAGKVALRMTIVPVVAPSGGVPIWPRISSPGSSSVPSAWMSR